MTWKIIFHQEGRLQRYSAFIKLKVLISFRVDFGLFSGMIHSDSASVWTQLNLMSFSGGMSGHYFLLSEQDGRSLMWRMGDPGKFNPQIVGVYNYVTIVAFVVTDQHQALDPAAFLLLLDTIKTDLQNVDLPMPKFLLR